MGPPPHARGSQNVALRIHLHERPTPACAGITPSGDAPQMVDRAHPRMRGDHTASGNVLVGNSGPPPHARGSPQRERHHDPHERPTPACAGITPASPAWTSTGTAHPRMRGDHGRDDAPAAVG